MEQRSKACLDMGPDLDIWASMHGLGRDNLGRCGGRIARGTDAASGMMADSLQLLAFSGRPLSGGLRPGIDPRQDGSSKRT
jgi:hypothetical protein